MVLKHTKRRVANLNVTSAKISAAVNGSSVGLKFAEITCYFIQNDSLHLLTAVLSFSLLHII